MKRTLRKQTLIVSALALTVGFGSHVLGQTENTAPNQIEKKTESSQAEKKEGGMQCPMMAAMKDVALFADSPPVLLGQAEQLNLTQQQQEQLQEIGESARKQALAVLNAEQRGQVARAPSGPLSMMQLAKLQKKEETGGEASEDKGMCPMCMKMMRKKMKGKAVSEPEIKPSRE